MRYTYPSHIKLKSKKDIQRLFSSGNKAFAQYTMGVYMASDQKGVSIGLSVSKKKFKKAVDRNRVKRILREQLRLNHQHFIRMEAGLNVMYIYLGNELPNPVEINNDIEKINSVILKKLNVSV